MPLTGQLAILHDLSVQPERGRAVFSGRFQCQQFYVVSLQLVTVFRLRSGFA